MRAKNLAQAFTKTAILLGRADQSHSDGRGYQSHDDADIRDRAEGHFAGAEALDRRAERPLRLIRQAGGFAAGQEAAAAHPEAVARTERLMGTTVDLWGISHRTVKLMDGPLSI